MTTPISIKLGFNCPECSQPIPLGGLVASARCDHCQSNVKPDWRKLLNLGNPAITVVQWALERPKQQKERGGFGAIQLDVARAKPKCSCGAALDLDAVTRAVAAGEAVACARCRAPIAARAAPQHVRRHYPEIAVAIGETTTAEASGDVAKTAKPMLFSCMNCGAPLNVDGSKRTIDCESCDRSNYLPDGLWLRLHPARKREAFVLLVQGR